MNELGFLPPSHGESFVIGAVGLGRYRQALVLPHRIGAPCTLFEEVFDRKVVERDADRTYERAGAPAARDVELVGSLLLERPVDVDQPVMIVSGLKCPIEPSVRMVCISSERS